MKSYLDLIPISAKIHKKQSRMTRFCIVLAVFLVTAIFGMADMEMRSEQLQEIKNGGNWHVMFGGIDEEDAAIIAQRPEVTCSGWYEDITGESNYNVMGVTTGGAGLDIETFENIMPTKLTEGVFPSEKNEVIITENAKGGSNIKLGDTIKLEDSGTEPVQLKVVGFFEGSAKLLKKDDYFLLFTTDGFRSAIPHEKYSSQFIVQLSRYCNMQKVIADITQQFNLRDNQVLNNGNLLAALGQSNNTYVFQLYFVAGILFIIVLMAGVMMIASSLNSNVIQKTEFFGMIRCLGATKKQVMHFVQREAFQWCKSAIPIGVGLGIVIVWILCAVLKFLCPGYFDEMPTFGVSWISIFSGVAVGFLTVLLAARAPARKAAKVSPLAAVSGNASYLQPVKTAAKTGFFKVEAALGIHHAKSSKKNFFLMVGSFALSIILFLCFSTAVDFMNHAVKPLRPYNPDISFVSADDTCSIDSSLIKELSDNPKIKKVYGRMFAYSIPAKVNGKDKVINLISYEDNQFQWAEDSLLEGSIDDVKQKDNTALIEFGSKNTLNVGDTLLVNIGDEQKEISIAGLLSSAPFDSSDSVENIICSEATFRRLTGYTDYTIIDIQLSNDATDYDVNEIRGLVGAGADFSDSRLSNSQARGAYYSFVLFIYGFLVIIGMITIFNILNSIAMSVSARIKQYGAMRAIGMSDHQIINMVSAEAAAYAVSGIIVGSIIGLPLHKLMFEKMITSHWGDVWQLPIGVLGIIILIVVAASIVAVKGPSKQIQNMSIVDTICAK